LKPISFCFVLVFFSFIGQAQIVQTDSTKRLNEVIIRGYYNPQPLLRSVSAVNLIDSSLLDRQNNSSLVSTLNTVSGVRMEERSPGSYRLSLRGSLLRSPFGIRNVKIYIDDFPLTDAGGNSYLNSLDVDAVGNMEIFKGPESSIFGANTGGAILINPPAINRNEARASVTAGSYGLFHQTAQLQHQFKNYRFSFSEGYQRSDGYRQNSAMERKYFQTMHQWDYAPAGSLKAFVFYSDLAYKTPGGLTAAQIQQDPKLARPATPTIPGAITQQAAIYNKTVFGGLSNTYQIDSHFKHVLAVFTSYTDFKNPFITNYEKRYESTIGLRTFLAYNKNTSNFGFSSQIGLETSRTKSEIRNSDNDAGKPADLQALDHLRAGQNFAFVRFNFDIDQKWLIELASSLNFFRYNYESFFPIAIAQRQRNFDAKLMPKIAVSYLLADNVSIRGSISKGYSTPTIAEVRSSDNQINSDLQAESGWNYEAGIRYRTANDRFYVNANVFQFELRDAIVRRLNENDAEYFINAGGTKQRGLELDAALWLVKNSSRFLTGIQWRSNYTFSHFRFGEFESGNAVYTGNKLTGVPAHTLINSLNFDFKKGLYLFLQYNHTTSIPLNDANSVFAAKYDLIEAKAGMRMLKIARTPLAVFIGVNNLLNEKYSLGNDLNAANGRYFNPAAGINFYAGLSIKI